MNKFEKMKILFYRHNFPMNLYSMFLISSHVMADPDARFQFQIYGQSLWYRIINQTITIRKRNNNHTEGQTQLRLT